MKHLLVILLTCFAFTVFAQETKVPADTLSAKEKKREDKRKKKLEKSFKNDPKWTGTMRV